LEKDVFKKPLPVWPCSEMHIENIEPARQTRVFTSLARTQNSFIAWNAAPKKKFLSKDVL
jgi:hypothetical protein